MHRTVKVQAAFDSEAGVWFVEDCDIPGLSAEAATVELLVEKLPGMIADLLEENGYDDDDDNGGDCDTVPIELIAHAVLAARVPEAA